jgi:hypothetical protein
VVVFYFKALSQELPGKTGGNKKKSRDNLSQGRNLILRIRISMLLLEIGGWCDPGYQAGPWA